MNKYFLTEGFAVEENQEGSLTQTLISVSNRTKFDVIDPIDINIYSVLREPGTKSTGFDLVKFQPAFVNISLFEPQTEPEGSYFHPSKKNVGTMPFDTFLKEGLPKEVLEEIVEVGYFLQIKTEMGTKLTLVPAKGFLSTFCRQMGVGKLNEGIDPIRDLYLSSRLVYAEPFTLVYRTDGKFGKAFGCFSKNFGDMPQTLILDFKEKLKQKFPSLTVRHWEYTHSITSVDFSFNDKVFKINGMRVTPGVRLSLSDIGDSSYKLQNVLFCNGSVVTLPDAVQKKRTKSIDVKELVTGFFESCQPEQERIIQIVKNSASRSVSNKGAEIIRIFKEIGFSTAIGQRSASAIIAQFEEQNETTSLEDVLCNVLKIPGTVKTKECKSCLTKVSESIGKVFTLKSVAKLAFVEAE